MDILFVVPYIPSLVRVRPYNLIRFLSARGHRVTVLTVWTNEHERAEVEQLRPLCHRVRALPFPRWRSLANCVRALPGSEPLQAVYSWHAPLVAQLTPEELAATDVAHVEHLRGSRYGLYLKARGVPVVWDSVDCISLLFRQAAQHSKRRVSRWLTQFELGRTERREGQLVSEFAHVLVTSPADRDALQALTPQSAVTQKISVVPNGVNLDYFRPDPAARREPATLVLSGKMSYHANVTMAVNLVQTIMPRVWASRPEVKLTIVGKDPTPEVLALARPRLVTVTGTVSDLRPYLQTATLAVAPITYGVGIQNKILEALACGTPVICSPPAVSALKAEPGADLVVADGPEAFAAAILRLLDDPAEQQRLGAAGRRYVETHHDWAAITARVEEVYHGVTRSRH